MHQAEDILMSNYCILPFYYYNDLYMLKDYVDGTPTCSARSSSRTSP